MADAVLWQLLESLQTRIRALVFTTQTGDTVPPPKDADVVIRKKKFELDDLKNDRTEATPGILIAPLGGMFDPSQGTNERDDETYAISVQLITRDPSYREDNLKTYLKWQEQIRKLLQSAADTNVQGDEGCVNIGWVPSQYPCVANLWPAGKYFVADIEVRLIARETRGITS